MATSAASWTHWEHGDVAMVLQMAHHGWLVCWGMRVKISRGFKVFCLMARAWER
jgi:hypothetical protein